MPPLHQNLLSTIGNTPLVRLHKLYPESDINVYGKLEAFNPGGSIKDRTAFAILSAALAQGQVKPGDTVIESSSGNMAIGLAQACLYFGLQLIVVVDPNVNNQTVQILKTYGACLDQVETPDSNGGYLQARIQRVQELLSLIKNSYWPNQYANSLNPLAHYETMREVVEALDGRLDYLLAATSTCGTIMGCARYVQQHQLPTKIIAVDAVGSVIFDAPPAKRLIPGHGASQLAPLLDQSLVDSCFHVSDKECVEGCRRLLEREAILAGGSSGAVVSALAKLLPQLKPNATCALILCDRGERYLDTIYSDQWVNEHLSTDEMQPSCDQILDQPDTNYKTYIPIMLNSNVASRVARNEMERVSRGAN